MELAILVSHVTLFYHMCRETSDLLVVPHLVFLSPPQVSERPMVGVNGLDVTTLRPFDLVIPFTIKKGEITGE